MRALSRMDRVQALPPQVREHARQRRLADLPRAEGRDHGGAAQRGLQHGEAAGTVHARIAP
jgi:hypothetical protein